MTKQTVGAQSRKVAAARRGGRARVRPEKASLRVQHGPQAANDDGSAVRDWPHPTQPPERRGLGRVSVPESSRSVRITVQLGLASNSLGFWRRRRYRTAALFAEALTERTGLRITPSYVRYWESAIGVPPAQVVEAIAELLEVPPTLIWTQEQLRHLARGSRP